MQDIVIIIPTLNPKDKLIEIVKNIKENKFEKIIVVNDGSNSENQMVFEKIKDDVVLINHKMNEGKGRAIKDALKYIHENYKNVIGAITVDGDGQHLIKDIVNVATKLMSNNNKGDFNLILGVRNLYGKDVPKKSRIGNKFSSKFFKLQTGVDLKDTQTGLRAIPAKLISYATEVNGNRYDYEMNVLTKFAMNNVKIDMVDIETVYEDNNKESHFRAIRDSLLIYKQLVKFAIIAVSSAIIDIGLFTILTNIFKEHFSLYILYSTIIARATSGIFNFWANKRWSFESKKNTLKQAYKYLILFIFQMFASSLLVTIFGRLPINITIVKIFVDLFIFFINYFVERRFIFNK